MEANCRQSGPGWDGRQEVADYDKEMMINGEFIGVLNINPKCSQR